MDVTKNAGGHWLRLLAAITALAVSIACSESTHPAPPDGSWSANETWSGRVIITTDAGASHWPSDPVTIHAVVVKNDSLELTVSFGGGCRDHVFMLLTDAAWMESYPVQVGARLAHDAEGDACKALLSRVLRFDLSPLKAAYNESYHTTTGIIRMHVGSVTVTYSW